jgi:hypothetical protein
MKMEFSDHGLPLIQLKEARRELVLSLQQSADPISQQTLSQIVNIQIAISAVETVMEDLDSELDGTTRPNAGPFISISGRA